jgi:hypothetical protein
MKQTVSFDTNQLIGKQFKYNGEYGLSEWTDIVKDVEIIHEIEFDKPFIVNGEFKAEKVKIIGFKYNLHIRATRTNNIYEFENCIFLEDDRKN